MSVETEQQIALPNGWEWVPIGETGEYINGFAFKPGHREASGLPIVRIQNLTDESKPLNATNIEVPVDYKIDTGDMLMSWSATLDVFVWRRGPALVNQHIFKVVSEERVMRKGLLFYWLKRAIQQLQKTDHLHGSTMMHINRGPFMAHLVPLPPAAEQTRIVAKLEELLSDLDAGVAELKAAQKKLAQYRQSLLKAAVEGALTAQWREEQRAKHKPTETGAQLLARILQERRARWETKQLAKFKDQGKAPPIDWQKKYPDPVQPDTSGLPELPQGWVWASGEQLCEFITKGTTPPKELDAGNDKSIPFLRVTNLTDKGTLDLADKVFVSEETHKGFLARSAVYPNDVLMNIVGPPLGQVAVVPDTFDEWNINQAIAIFRAVDGVSPRYVCLYLLAPVAQQWLKARSKTTAGQTNLTLEVCRSLPFPLPPEEEQRALVVALDGAVDSITRQRSAIEIGIKQSTTQRQNILRAAFSGQLVPQDPNDEPASVLLDRIRAERAQRDALKKPRGRKVKEAA